ncbi:hypothetical protein [Streptomyces sp. Ac-502]|uniref:hypothetical protein n=1 Tax=Streptomyces sp. Ac-502 TaxID=3342801 RepID=UPI003862816F
MRTEVQFRIVGFRGGVSQQARQLHLFLGPGTVGSAALLLGLQVGLERVVGHALALAVRGEQQGRHVHGVRCVGEAVQRHPL